MKFFRNRKVVGLKFYYGIKPVKDTTKKPALRLMIVGIDKDGKNVYIRERGSDMAVQAAEEEGGLEYGQCSPPCDGLEP